MLQIITDSTAEFTAEEARALGIHILPLTVVFNGVAYREGVELSKDEFYERLLGGEFPHTSQPSVEEFTDVYAKTKGEETLVLLISSALSGTTDTARMAVKQGGFSKIHVYETLCTTAMLRFLVEEACKHRDKSAAEVMKILDELRPRLRLHACVDTLDYLRKGGRIKRSVAIVGGLLGIKPLITVTPEGAVAVEGTVRGQKKAIKAIAEKFLAEKIDPAYPVYFLRTDSEEPPRALMSEVGRAEDRIFRICCAVGTHIGPNAAGIVYVVK